MSSLNYWRNEVLMIQNETAKKYSQVQMENKARLVIITLSMCYDMMMIPVEVFAAQVTDFVTRRIKILGVVVAATWAVGMLSLVLFQ